MIKKLITAAALIFLSVGCIANGTNSTLLAQSNDSSEPLHQAYDYRAEKRQLDLVDNDKSYVTRGTGTHDPRSWYYGWWDYRGYNY